MPPTIAAMMLVPTTAHAYDLEIIPKEEVYFSTSHIMGEQKVKIPDRYTPLEAPTRPETIVLPDFRTPADYATALASLSVQSSSNPDICNKTALYGEKAPPYITL
jgi:hypothetical protein